MKKFELEIPINQTNMGKKLLSIRVQDDRKALRLITIVPVSIEPTVKFRLIDEVFADDESVDFSKIHDTVGELWGTTIKIRYVYCEHYYWNEQKVCFGRLSPRGVLVVEVEEKEHDDYWNVEKTTKVEEGQQYCINTKILFEKWNGELTLGKIENMDDYYDLYNANGDLACCMCETVVVDQVGPSLVSLKSDNGEGTVYFSLTHEEFSCAATRTK